MTPQVTPRGLPGPLPEGEKILWQGSPDWKALAWRAFHLREAAAWFAALAVWRFASASADGWQAGLINAAGGLPLALLGLGLLALLAYMSARATVYTLTDRRVALRIGVALTATVNVPLARIQNADLKVHGATGDVALGLGDGTRIAWGTLWPHVRPWRLKVPQPTLRAIAEPKAFAAMLAEALAPGSSVRAAQIRAAEPAAVVAGRPAALAS